MAGTDRDAFARRWADEIAGMSYVSIGHDELVAYPRDLTDQWITAALAAEFDPRAAYQIGAALVAAHFTNTSTLSQTLTLIIEQMWGPLGSPQAAYCTDLGVN
jgi:hypothetical protein